MMGRVLKSLNSTVKNIPHFKNRLVEGKYLVHPPPQIPPHIVKPQWATSKNPKFAEYQGKPQILSPQQIKKLKKSAQIASTTLRATEKWLIERGKQDLEKGKDGTLTTQQIDRFVFDKIIEQGAYPTPIGFIGFPKSVCLSVNQCIVHGIGSDQPIYFGDKINMDVTVFFDGFHGDTNLSLIYGGPEQSRTPEVRKIVQLTQKALYQAISLCKPGTAFNKIGRRIQQFARDNGIFVCQHFTGHGVGQLLHMPPMVHHVYYPFEVEIMKPGIAFTIEPVMSHYQSSKGLIQWQDGFTVISQNNPNAQFQHTILITETGCEVITQREGENIPNPNKNIQNLKIY